MWAAALSLVLLEQPLLSAAYSWAFQNDPQQCSNLSIQISGSDGKPPYRALIIPSGSTPFSNGTEVRKILDMPFDGNSNSLSFQLDYPTNSQFVTVVSDASGFGSGGTSASAVVTSSSDSSCYDASKSVAPLFSFSVANGSLAQCTATRIFWNPSSVQGTPNFLGVIPGGDSFAVPEGSINDESAQGLGTGFSWSPSIRSGTTVILVGGDNRGNGTAGSSPFTIGNSITNDNSCLNNNSPSSTAGTPAGGGSYATSTTGAGLSGGSSTNVGAIVGGVIGGVVVVIAALLLVLLFFRRRRRYHKHQNEKPVDLAADDDDVPPRASRNELPEYYQPEPFVVPEPAPSTMLSDTTDSDDRRHSFLSASGTDLLSTSAPSSSTRKAGYQPRQMRPVNIIQHDDAGPSTPYKDEDPETIELPPAYTNIRKAESGAGTPASETPPTNLTAPA